MSAPTAFEPALLGRTGLRVARLGMGSSYGVPAPAVERAFDLGVNYLYWGSFRTRHFQTALRNLSPRRDRMVLVLQSFTRAASLMAWSVERGLRRIGYDHADVLLLGLWNRTPPPRIMDAAHRLKQRGLARFLAISTHRRPMAATWARESAFDIVHVRYNAVHTGAERDVFPNLPANGPGIVSYTATCWGRLLSRRRVPRGERIPTAADCYRFVMSHPAVHVCMCGPSTEAHAREATEALRLGPMADEEISWMRRVGAAVGRRPR